MPDEVKPAAPEKFRLTLTLPVDLLRESPDDGVMLLRLAQSVNAVSTFASLIRRGFENDGQKRLSRARDNMQVFLTGAAYMSEALKLIEEYGERPWRLVRLAEQSGLYHFKDLVALRRKLGGDAGAMQHTFLKRWRNKYGFHWDKKPVADLVMQLPADSQLEMWRWYGPQTGADPYNVSDAAFRLATGSMFPHIGKDDRPDRLNAKELAAAQFALAVVYEAILFGFLLERGKNPMTFITVPTDDD